MASDFVIITITTLILINKNEEMLRSIAYILTLLIQILWRWHAIVITRICWISLKSVSSHLNVSLWTNLLMFLNSWRNIIISICTISYKLSLRHYIVLRMHYFLSSLLSALQSKLTLIIWMSFELLSSHFQLSLRSYCKIFLNRILNIIAPICCIILKFTFR